MMHLFDAARSARSRSAGMANQRLPEVLQLAANASIVLAFIVGVRDAYDASMAVAAGAAVLLLCAAALALWRLGRSSNPLETGLRQGTLAGAGLGLLWVVEIAINNVLTPPLPLRDRIDNSFWAAIALGIFVTAFRDAIRARRVWRGVQVGAWSGFISGLLACTAALTLIVFGMALLTADPLNVAEWATRGADERAPSMAAYFAFETLAGAVLHLTVLGPVMGAVLGAVAGISARISATISDRVAAAR